MIADALLAIVLGILDPLIGLLPVVDLTGSLDAYAIQGYLNLVDAYVPILTPLQFVAQALAWGQWFIPIALAVWLWKLLPGKAT